MKKRKEKKTKKENEIGTWKRSGFRKGEERGEGGIESGEDVQVTRILKSLSCLIPVHLVVRGETRSVADEAPSARLDRERDGGEWDNPRSWHRPSAQTAVNRRRARIPAPVDCTRRHSICIRQLS